MLMLIYVILIFFAALTISIGDGFSNLLKGASLLVALFLLISSYHNHRRRRLFNQKYELMLRRESLIFSARAFRIGFALTMPSS